jgi:serine O-acetyltransferase
MDDSQRMDQCKGEVESAQRFREEIPNIVNRLVLSCSREDCFDHVGPEPIPSRDSVIKLIHAALRILYPGYFIRSRVDGINLSYYFGQEITAFYEALSEQITLALRHECIRHNLPCVKCEEHGQASSVEFMRELPRLRTILATDVRAAFEGDPAAKSYDEIIFSYPGLFAITVYRIAHELHRLGISLIPRIMSE